MQKLTLVTPPALPAVDYPDFLAHARLDLDEGLIDGQAALDAAIQDFDGPEGMLGRCLVTQTWAVGCASWEDPLRLPMMDVQSVTVKYLDSDGEEQTLPAAQYELLEDHRGAYLVFRRAFTSPALDDDRAFPITVTMTAGFGGPGDIPAPIRIAIKLRAVLWYDHRASATEMRLQEIPHNDETILRAYRRVGI